MDGHAPFLPGSAVPTAAPRDGTARTVAVHLDLLRTRVAQLTRRCHQALLRVADDGGLDPAAHLDELRRVLLRGERRPTAPRRAQLELALAVVRRADPTLAAQEVAPDALPALVTDLHRLERALARSASVGHAPAGARRTA